MTTEKKARPRRVRTVPTATMGEGLAGLTEIAQRAGVQKPVVSVWARRHEEFPPPLTTLRTGPIWWWPDVQAWLVETNRPWDQHLTVEEVNRGARKAV